MGANINFPYRPLTTSSQTRIIALAPGDNDDPIHCILLVIDLDDDWRLHEEECQVQPSQVERFNTYLGTVMPDREGIRAFMVPNLRLQPGDCPTLHTFQRYTALSYVWGDQKDLQEITLNGKPFHVGHNLYLALKRLRRREAILGLSDEPNQNLPLNPEAMEHHMSSAGLLVWIDSICINQNDLAERAAQVKLMSRIYQQADHVHADLGHAESDDGMKLIRLLTSVISAGRLCESQQSSSTPSHPREQQSSSGSDTAALQAALGTEYQHYIAKDGGKTPRVQLPNPASRVLEDYGIPPEDDALWACWRSFLDSSYFERLWIVQEFSLAKSVTMWFANVSIDPEVVAYFYRYLAEFSINRALYINDPRQDYSEEQSLPNIRAAIRLFSHRRCLQSSVGQLTRPACLLDTLEFARCTKATDLRDKVFGLLGLAVDGPEFHHLVNYSRGVEQIYQDFAECFIKKGQGISMLYRAGSRNDKSLNIPTWVPDWSQASDEHILCGPLSATLHDASGLEVLSLQCVDSKLAIKGYIIDTVDHLSPRMPSEKKWTTFSDMITILWHGGNLFVNHASNQSNMMEIILETLMCGSLGAMTTIEVDRLRQGLIAMFGHSTFLINGGKEEDSPWLRHKHYFTANGLDNTLGRRWCMTKKGKFGLVPGGAKKGDRIALFGRHTFPFFIRPATQSRSTKPAHAGASNRPWWRLKKRDLSKVPEGTDQDQSGAILNRSSIASILLPWRKSEATEYTFVGHGYIHSLDTAKYYDTNSKRIQEIVLI